MSVHSKGRQLGVHTTGCLDNVTGKANGQDDDWEQGSTSEHRVSKPWKKHHNKQKSQKVKHKMKRAIDS